MNANWLTSRVEDGVLWVSSARANACLVRDQDSLRWAKELLELHARHGCDTVVVDLADIEFISQVAIMALRRLQSLLPDGSEGLIIGGVRPHVLAIFLAWAPTLGATNDPATFVAASARTSLAA